MAFRKRRSKGTWLPTLPTEGAVDEEDSATRFIQLTMPGNGNPTFGIIPITYDDTSEAGDAIPANTDMSAITNNEYILKRILGSLHLWNSSGGSPATPAAFASAALITAAFFVARRDDNNEPDTPIGYLDSSLLENLENYSPDRAETARLPWIWIRQWIIGNSSKAAYFAGGGYSFDSTGDVSGLMFAPGNNWQASDIRSGPHIDAKSRRRVPHDHRLFFVLQGRTLPQGNSSTSGMGVDAALRVRLFGTMVKARQRGTF